MEKYLRNARVYVFLEGDTVNLKILNLFDTIWIDLDEHGVDRLIEDLTEVKKELESMKQKA